MVKNFHVIDGRPHLAGRAITILITLQTQGELVVLRVVQHWLDGVEIVPFPHIGGVQAARSLLQF